MLLPQVLRSRTQLARPLLQRSIRLHTPHTAAGASPLRCFFATVSEGLEGEASEPAVPSPSSSVAAESESSDNTTADTSATITTTTTTTQAQTQTPTETQTPTQIETHTQTQTESQTQTQTAGGAPRRIRLRKLASGVAPIRRVRCDLHDPDAIARAGFNIRRSGEEASYRIITLERLLEVCRDPTVVPTQNIMLRKLEFNPEKKTLLKETTYNIQHSDLAEERKWVAAVTEGPQEAAVGRSPILELLGVADAESDMSKYVVVNHNVSSLGIGMQQSTPEQLRNPVESFFPRRIEENMKFLKLAGTNTHAIVEIKDGQFHSYPIITAIKIVYNQINKLTHNLDRDYVMRLPQVRGGREGKIYRSMLVQVKQATEYAKAILQTPISEPISITRATTGKPETFSRYDALLLYFEESAEAMRKLRKVVAHSILAPGVNRDIVEDRAEADEYETFAEMALLNRRITNNMEAIKAAPEGYSQIAVERFAGTSLMRPINALDVVTRQLANNIENIQNEINIITKPRGIVRFLNALHQPRAAAAAALAQIQKDKEEEEEEEEEEEKARLAIKFVRSSSPAAAGAVPIRYINHDSMYRPGASSTPTTSTSAPVTTTTIPGGSREYSTSNVTFHGLEPRRKDVKKRNAFGRIIPMDAPPPKKWPIVVKEGTIRHKLQLAEQKRLEAMQGLGYSLMAGSQLGGSRTGTMTEVVEKEGDGGGVSTWEGTGEIGGLNDESGLTPLKKGDLCELRIGSGTRIAIYLRPSPNGQPTSDFLLESGDRAMYAAARVAFAIPSFISEEKAAEIITTVDVMRSNSDLPPQRHNELVLPRSAIADVIQKMRVFYDKARGLYAAEKANFVKLYERMALEGADTELTLFEAAEEIFGESYGDEQLYTTHLALMEDGVRYLTDKGAHRATSTFKVRAKRDVRMIEFVTEQVRVGTGAEQGDRKGVVRKLKHEMPLLESFAKKARVLIDISRKNTAQDLSAKGGPVTRVPVKQVEWDENDIKFIDYIKAGVLQYGSQSVPMDGLVPVILRAMNRYEGELDNIIAYQFCTDIGAWNKWEDLALRQKNVGYPGMGTSRQADEDQKRLDVVNGPKCVEKLKLVDSMKHIRKDWGDMEVFAIDDITAHEIDDGISLERIDEKTNWVHMHIANPTAWLPPNHWLSDLAFRRKQSLYLPNQVLPMLPPALTDKIGLASNRGVMTMSAKVNMDGEVLDFNLQPGFVRNVKRFTYDTVSAALGYHQSAYTTFEVGEFPKPARKDTAKPNQRQIKDLKTLNEIALAFRKKRVQNDLIMVVTPRVNIDVHTGLTPFVHPTGATPHLYRGHPAMRLSIETSTAIEDGSHFLVSEMMQLANSITAKFCGKHNIAAPFRVMEYDYDRADLVASYKNMILPARNELGSVEPELGIQYMMLIGKTRISASPSPHRLMGLDDGYIRATSPLRRYSDMITHWQIEAFLQGKEPRTHKQIAPFALELERGERLSAFTMKESKRFWAAVAIKRLMDLQDPKLPKTLTFMVMEKVLYPSMSIGLVWELGMAGKVAYESAAQEMGVRAGDTIEVEPMVAVPGERMVWFKYKRVIKRRQLDDVFL
ncbi:uncharacterized protein H6S33_005387 [Morchella sextelata]|uniref:uncharacterized protein n=1 Tax=Morchella sextelata TaxID=1174677 RepID=UPI001D044B0F|nr:uncharacterized protein H6S33_005387 [Morchella sextelata]KAH0613501.1 hypothetical protein H6S33_005387 [Morchella sextelata]